MFKVVVVSALIVLCGGVLGLFYVQTQEAEKIAGIEARLAVLEKNMDDQVELNTIQKEINSMTIDAFTSVTNILKSGYSQ